MEQYSARYVAELVAEKSRLDSSHVHSATLLAQEIDRVQTGTSKDKMFDVHVDKPTQISAKIRIPNKEYPKVNFVGRILGQKGSNLKRLQEETGVKIFIQGQGSMRDSTREAELRKEGGKYLHLTQELHVYLEAFGNPVDCYQKMSLAIYEISKYLSPDYVDEDAGMYAENGAEVPVAGPVWPVAPIAPPMPPVVRIRGPELRPPRPMRPPMPPGHVPVYSPAPGVFPPPVRRPALPVHPPMMRVPRPAGIRPPGVGVPPVPRHVRPPLRPYAVPPAPYVVPDVSVEPIEYDYTYGYPETGVAPEDFTSDEWAKDITTTEGNFRAKAPIIRPARAPIPARFAAHPYARPFLRRTK